MRIDPRARLDAYGRAVNARDATDVAGKNHDGTTFDLANALHLSFDEAGKIVAFHNWYGQG